MVMNWFLARILVESQLVIWLTEFISFVLMAQFSESKSGYEES